MSNSILIMGQPGTGKSTSIRNLDPSETFIINVLDKPLPFRGANKLYSRVTKNSLSGNYYSSDNYADILSMISAINIKRPEIKNVIIDDFQYVMANEFMRRAKEKSYEKFTDIGQNAWKIVTATMQAREDLTFFILSHTETDSSGAVKCKTIGKMLDEKVTLEGMFTVIFHSLVIDGRYKFLTQNNGIHIARSSMGMFEKDFIDNDLLYIKDKIEEYVILEGRNVIASKAQPPNPKECYKKLIDAALTIKNLMEIYSSAKEEPQEILDYVIANCSEKKQLLNTPATH